MVLVGEELRQELLPAHMPFQRFFRGFLVHLERDHQVGLQIALELSLQDDGVLAVGAPGGAGGLLGNDLAAARRAGVEADAVGLAFGPVASGLFLPLHVVGAVALLLLQLLDGLHVEDRVAEGTFHLLRGAFKLDVAAAEGAFV